MMSKNLTIPDDLMARLLDARHIAVLTGAGMSADSGIATFRDASTGLWSQFDPRLLASPQGWANDRDLVWAWYEHRRATVMKAQPNAGHYAIAQLANALQAAHGKEVQVNVITQNVDDLHERAGSACVVHLHGSLFAPRCKACGRPAHDLPEPSDAPVMKLSPPRCTHCNGYVRPGVVWFGEDLPHDAWRQAKTWVNDCDCLMVIGTSGVVWPAAQLPIDAHAQGKLVVEVNPHVSDITRHTGIYWASTSAQALPALLAEINANGDKTS